jgi:transcriptional regulator with XRE-family HTH domain
MIERLGDKVRRLREQANLSQSELASILELSERSKGYISEIERGKKIPPAILILRIARHFQVTTDYLLRDELGAPEDNETTS